MPMEMQKKEGDLCSCWNYDVSGKTNGNPKLGRNLPTTRYLSKKMKITVINWSLSKWYKLIVTILETNKTYFMDKNSTSQRIFHVFVVLGCDQPRSIHFFIIYYFLFFNLKSLMLFCISHRLFNRETLPVAPESHGMTCTAKLMVQQHMMSSPTLRSAG